MEISISRQVVEFFLSTALGAGLGLAYDIFRLVRARVRAKFITAAVDLMYWMLAAAAVLWFVMTVQGGEFRIYTALGASIGLTIYFLAFSPPFLVAALVVVDFFIRTASFILRPFCNLFRKTAARLQIFIENHFKSRIKKCMIQRRRSRSGEPAGEKPLGGEDVPMKRRKMGLIPKIIVGCLAVYAVINLLHLQTDINDLREKRDELIELVEKQRRENAMLEESVNAELDEEAVAEAARSELGLVAPDEIIFIDTSH